MSEAEGYQPSEWRIKKNGKVVAIAQTASKAHRYAMAYAQGGGTVTVEAKAWREVAKWTEESFWSELS